MQAQFIQYISALIPLTHSNLVASIPEDGWSLTTEPSKVSVISDDLVFLLPIHKIKAVIFTDEENKIKSKLYNII